jgi:hypothetical protein
MEANATFILSGVTEGGLIPRYRPCCKYHQEISATLLDNGYSVPPLLRTVHTDKEGPMPHFTDRFSFVSLVSQKAWA